MPEPQNRDTNFPPQIFYDRIIVMDHLAISPFMHMSKALDLFEEKKYLSSPIVGDLRRLYTDLEEMGYSFDEESFKVGYQSERQLFYATEKKESCRVLGMMTCAPCSKNNRFRYALFDVMVRERLQNQGIGSVLLEAVVAWIKRQHLKVHARKIHLEARVQEGDDFEDARMFFSRQHFVSRPAEGVTIFDKCLVAREVSQDSRSN